VTKLLNVLIVILALALIFVIVYPQIQENRPVTLRLACDSSAAALPFLVAVQESLFQQNRINPELVFYSDPELALADLFAGKVDVGAFPWSTVLKRWGETGDTLKVFMCEEYRTSLPVDAIVVPAKSKANSVTELRGKKFAYPPQLRDYIPVMLVSAGLTDKDLNLVEVGMSGLIAELESGNVDAAWLVEPLLCPLDTARFRILQPAALAKYVSQPFPGAAIGFAPSFLARSRVVPVRLKIAMDAAAAIIDTKADQVKSYLAMYFHYCENFCGFCRIPEPQRLAEINKPSVASLASRLAAVGVVKGDLDTKTAFVEPSKVIR
jgi:NitT/TauT family transport system substrate-binding protein